MRIASVCLWVLSLALLAGCGQREAPVDRAAKEGILLIDSGAEPATLDPQLASGQPEHKVIVALFEGLLVPHPEREGEVLPGVAEEWEHNDDASVWTFRLRENARWSDGSALTAHDFVRSYQRMLSPELAADFVTLLYRLKNAEDYHQGRLSNFGKVGVKALDEHTLQLTLVGPTPYFPTLLTHYAWYPVPIGTIEAHGGLFDRSGAWTRPGNIVGNGPFVLTRWEPNSRLQARPNRFYWNRENVALKGIDFFPIENDETSARMFDAGELHLTHSLPTSDYERRKMRGDPTLVEGQQLGTYYYALNTDRKPLDDARVRRALALALDRSVIVQHITRSGERPAHRFVPDGFNQYAYEGPARYKPAEARRLLAEAGFPNGAGFPELTLTYNTLEGHRRIAEAVANLWRENLGIGVRLENIEWRTYLERRAQGEFQIGRMGWVADYYDPLTFLEIMISESGNNDSNWSNAEYDRLVAQAMREPDMAARGRQMAAAEAILMEEMPVVPVYFYARRWLQDERVQGWHFNLLDQHPYQFVSLEGGN
ncbi:MAG: peptide ABC transporter substrate-binding protein [Verrucomicrobiota bacterium JB022]|nr:peptide ABC transporter substrate-binding protein [Verrucomicrobiota bacterium JB022]